MFSSLKTRIGIIYILSFLVLVLFTPGVIFADALTLTSGDNATTTPNVATSITGFQIVGNSASTTPVKLFSTSGTLSMTTTSGLTFDGASSGSTIYFSGTVANINAALSTLKYTRATTGTDTLEVSLVPNGEAFYTANNHLYKFIEGSFTWDAAKVAAEAETAYGATGYLATITSQDENDFVSGRLTGDGWIGGSDSAVEDTWKWITGPEAGTTFWQGTDGGSTVNGSYAHWNGGEPNQSGNEDCAETYVSSGSWNDLPCDAELGYVIEFGAPGDLPTVVAKNISIVTADVPAVTSLSPANASTTVSTSANLQIVFSKTVVANTGNILIKKSSDDSTVESINAAGGLVTGGGTNTITINPSLTLEDSTQYYVIIPNTAFKDLSNNNFDGLLATSTWTFTTGDFTPPIISSTTAIATSTSSGEIRWTTNELASSKINYGLTSSYGSSTVESDLTPRVLVHSIVLPNLATCSVYHFQIQTTDASNNIATSSDATFSFGECGFGSITNTVSREYDDQINKAFWEDYVKRNGINVVSVSSSTEIITLPQVISTTTPTAEIKPIPAKYQFLRNLKKGMTGDDVKKLQQFLNAQGFLLASSGAGSPGFETNFFSVKTELAVMKFQAAYKAEILMAQNFAKPTGWFYTYTRAVANRLLK